MGKPGKLPVKVGCKRTFHCGAFEVKKAINLASWLYIPMRLRSQTQRSTERLEGSCSICPTNLCYAKSSPSQLMPTQPSMLRPKASGHPWVLFLASYNSIHRPCWVYLQIKSRIWPFPITYAGSPGWASSFPHQAYACYSPNWSAGLCPSSL